MPKNIIKAHAKINIGLNIVSKRDDDFHNLETIFYPIYDLYDELIFEDSNEFQFVDDNNFDNIIVKTVNLLERETKRNISVKITLKKNIPIGAGLGGGSSDAAVVLKILNDLYELNLSEIKMKEIALELGSDVPFFLKGKPAIGKSRGEDLSLLDLNIEYPILLVNPGINISTKEAFSQIIPSPPEFDYNNIVNIPIDEFHKFIVNDFEKSIFQKHSEIENIKKSLYSGGALFSSMSGTGSAVYGIFKNINEAKNISKQFPNNYFIFISNSRASAK